MSSLQGKEECSKGVIIKGFVDLHIHGIGRYDTRTSRPEDILRIAELQGEKGVGFIVPTVYPSPIVEMRQNIEAIKKAMDLQKVDDRRQKAIRLSEIIGVHLEGPFLNPLKCGALDKDSFLKPDLATLRKLIDGYEDIVKIITISPELPGALKVIEKCRERRIKVNMGHSNATYREALDGKKAGATGITHIFNAMRPFHHRDPGIAGLALMDEDLYVEVIADGFHLSPEVLRFIFEVKSLDRIVVVSDSIKGAGRGRRPVCRGGVLAGSNMAVSEGVEVLRQIGLSSSVIKMATVYNPMRYVGLLQDC